MAKPTDLTNKTWQKIKGLTVPKTGFGDKLDAYQTAKKKTEVLATRTSASFEAAAGALQNITKAIPDAVKKCNKTLHKDTIEALGLYKGLIDKEGSDLHKTFVTYQGYVDEYKDLRVVCAKEQAVIEKQMIAEGKKAKAEVQQLISQGKLKEAIGAIKTAKADLEKIQKLADDSIAKPRVSKVAEQTPHADDRPGHEVFTALIDKQKTIIGIRTDAEGAMNALVKDAVEKLKSSANT